MKNPGLALLVVSFAFVAHAFAFDPSKVIPATGTIEFAFTPGDDAADLIVRTIDAARSQVLVQAFSFTHRGIADALVRAHHRGLDVQVIADRDQTELVESSAMQHLVGAGLPVFMDADHSAAHNKVIVIDHNAKQPTLITGSFNFTFAAQYRNAENVLVLHGNPDLTRVFFDNWQQHREHAIAVVRSQSR
ncbi:MAG: phospholipase D family protein [Betaproteobacteria bacterium]|nr:phospholipase D family protein [Betaproteobacteria bacterium]